MPVDLDTWSTHRVPPAERFPQWADVVRRQQLEWNLSATPAAGPYTARVVSRRSGAVRVSDTVSAPFRGVEPQVGAGDLVGISLALRGRMRCEYSGQSFVMAPGDLFLWDSTLARSFDVLDDRHEICFVVPRDTLPKGLAGWLPDSRALTTAAGSGLLGLVGAQMRAIARQMPNLGDSDISVGISAMMSTLTAAVAPAPAATHDDRMALLVEVKRHITQRLDDPRLCATTIAAAHGFSVRTLHLVFAGSGTTVSRWVRVQRLERCREELLAAPGGVGVTDIAFRWGFSDAAHFSRSFKKEFGATPSTYLHRARSRT